MKEYDLIVISNEPIPFGKAASNRMIAYAVSMAANGLDVLMLTFSGPSYGQMINKDTTGCFRGVDFRWTGETYYQKRSNLPIRVALYLKRKLLLTYLLLFKYKSKAYIQVDPSSRLALFVYIVSRFNKARFIREISETFERDTNKVKKFVRTAVCALADGIIAISSGIQDYFSNIPDASRFFILPIIVDVSRFNIAKTPQLSPYFCYCSGGVLQRDGFLDALMAFLDFHKKHPEYKLRCAFLYNDADQYHIAVMRLIKENQDCVEYLGSLPTTEIPELLVNASALLVTPSVDYKTRGFPTKLGEYLASSVPVICTAINDLKFLRDQNCVLMANPGDVKSIEKKMCATVEDKEASARIGLNGRIFMENNYTMENFLRPLIDFIFGRKNICK